MNATANRQYPTLTLHALTASELMTTNPVSIREDASVREALALLTDKGYSAAPVIDEAGRPVGVLSRTDLLLHQREEVTQHQPAIESSRRREEREHIPEGFQVEEVDRSRVREVMTPLVFAVAPDAPAAEVVRQLVRLKIHRLFVVDDAGILIGVISSIDLLRHLWA